MSTATATPQRDWMDYSLDGVTLRFIVHETRKVHGEIVHEWLLTKARELGIPGGSAFHGICGFGRNGVLHEQSFFELAGQLPVEVRIVCSREQAYRLLDLVEREQLSVFYVLSAARYGIAGAPKSDWQQTLNGGEGG